MHTVETSVIMTIAIYFFASFLITTFNLEVKIVEYIDLKYENENNTHMENGHKDSYNEDVQWLITGTKIDLILGGYLNGE